MKFTLSLSYASRRRISGLNIELAVNFEFSRPPTMLALALLSSFFHIVGVPRTWPTFRLTLFVIGACFSRTVWRTVS